MSEKNLRAIWGSPENPLRIGNLEIPCYVLEDGTRVLSGRGMQTALALGQSHGTLLRRFLDNNKLKPFISNELAIDISNPVRFVRPGRGGKPAVGYQATVLPDICSVVLEARKAGILTRKELAIAEQCEILVRAFAKVGIIALVDEATGYQEVRDRKALEKILEKWIAKELLPWTKRFPDEFYEQMFRLKKWQYSPLTVKRPSVIGHYTNDVVYERLEVGLLDELKRLNPTTPKGYKKNRHHQWLTRDVGHPKLRDHLNGVIALMRASANWDTFKRLLNRAYPKKGTTLELPLEDE